jgi:dihydropteroate synthase
VLSEVVRSGPVVTAVNGTLVARLARMTWHDGVVEEAVARQVDQVVVVRGPGPFARAVADGAVTRA